MGDSLYLTDFFIEYDSDSDSSNDTINNIEKYPLTIENYNKLNNKDKSIKICTCVYQNNTKIEGLYVTLCYISKGNIQSYQFVHLNIFKLTINNPSFAKSIWEFTPEYLCLLQNNISCVIKFNNEKDELIARQLNYYGCSKYNKNSRLYNIKLPIKKGNNKKFIKKYKNTPKHTIEFTKSLQTIKFCDMPYENNPIRQSRFSNYFIYDCK